MNDPEDGQQRLEVVPEMLHALQAQAQALEGVRQLHGDLARRLEAGEALRDRVDQLAAVQERMAAAQRSGPDGTERRGAAGGRLAVAVLFGALAGAALWSWWGADLLPGGGGRAGDRPASAAGGPYGSEGRDGTPAAADHSELLARVDRAEASARSAREERNRQLGETARLRQDLIQSQMRMDQLVATMDEFQPVVSEIQPAVVSRSMDREPSPLIVRLNQALKASGLSTLQVLEAGSVDGGGLGDLLFMELSRETGLQTIFPALSARLAASGSVVRLELELPAGGVADGQGAQQKHYPMPAWDEAAWSRVGLELPELLVGIAAVELSLRNLLLRSQYELVSVGGYEDGLLLDLVVTRVSAGGQVLQTFTAGQAEVLPAGPELELRDGEVMESGVSRPFYRGRSRLPLPGANYNAWREAVGG